MGWFSKFKTTKQSESVEEDQNVFVEDEVVYAEPSKNSDSNDELNETRNTNEDEYPKFKSVWVNPFQRMEPREKFLRFCLLTGIFPFTFVGCLIGSIYGLFIRKNRRSIHDKLHRANVLGCLLYLFTIPVIGAVLYGVSHKTNVTKLRVVSPQFLSTQGNEFSILTTDNGARRTLLLIEQGRGILPENIKEAKDYGFNVIHATVLKKEDEHLRDDLLWKSLVKELRIDPNDTIIAATLGKTGASLIEYQNVDEWLGLLLVSEVGDKSDDKFMIRFTNKKIICNGKETWLFSTIRPSDTPSYYISKERAFEILRTHNTKIKSKVNNDSSGSSNLTGRDPSNVDENVVKDLVQSMKTLCEGSKDPKNLCAMSESTTIPSTRLVQA